VPVEIRPPQLYPAPAGRGVPGSRATTGEARRTPSRSEKPTPPSHSIKANYFVGACTAA
jgi:hypothetical protein